MSIPWMPLYVADYLADTGHLNAAEHGAYLLLLMHAWRTGKIPNDDRSLASITRMSARQWVAMRPKIEAFFEPGWVHGRLMSEYKKAQDKSLSRSEAGARGGKAKALKNNDTGLANASELPEQNPSPALPSSSQSQSEVISQEEITSASLRSASPIEGKTPTKQAKKRTRIDPDRQPTPKDRQAAEDAGMDAATFREQWRAFRDFHQGKGSLMADWPAAWRTWCGNSKRFGAPRAGPRMTGGDYLARVASGSILPFAPLSGAPQHDDTVPYDLDLERAAAAPAGVARLSRGDPERGGVHRGPTLDLSAEDPDRPRS